MELNLRNGIYLKVNIAADRCRRVRGSMCVGAGDQGLTKTSAPGYPLTPVPRLKCEHSHRPRADVYHNRRR